MCNKAVATDSDLTGVVCGFKTGSAMKYSARLFCKSTEGFFYPSAAGTAVVAASNGGKVIKTSLTYNKKIDASTDNVIVNTLLCKMASQLAVAPDRVQDEFSGWCGNPAKDLPAAKPEEKKEEPKTDTKTEEKTETKTEEKTPARVLVEETAKE